MQNSHIGRVWLISPVPGAEAQMHTQTHARTYTHKSLSKFPPISRPVTLVFSSASLLQSFLRGRGDSPMFIIREAQRSEIARERQREGSSPLCLL